MEQPRALGTMEANRRVTAYKTHAHIYCKRMGLNPEEAVDAPHQHLAGVATRVPQWYIVAERLFDLAQLMLAMREGNSQMLAANEAHVQPASERKPS